MRRPRISIARLMVVVLVIALDCAALRAAFPLFDPGYLMVVPVLEVGPFRMVSRRGRARPFWVGFEAFGWAALLAYAAGLRRPLNFWLCNVLPIQAVRFCEPRWPSVARGLESTFMAWDVLLGLPVLLLAVIGGRLALRVARRHSGELAAAPGLVPEASSCVS